MTAQALVSKTTKAAVVCAAALAALAWLGGQPMAAVSLIAGVALGLVPIVSWGLLVGPLFEGRGALLVIVASLTKIILVVGSLYYLVSQKRVDAVTFAAGFLLPVAIMATLALVPQPTTEARA